VAFLVEKLGKFYSQFPHAFWIVRVLCVDFCSFLEVNQTAAKRFFPTGFLEPLSD
jgi:hypothetical protein